MRCEREVENPKHSSTKQSNDICHGQALLNKQTDELRELNWIINMQKYAVVINQRLSKEPCVNRSTTREDIHGLMVSSTEWYESDTVVRHLSEPFQRQFPKLN